MSVHESPSIMTPCRLALRGERKKRIIPGILKKVLTSRKGPYKELSCEYEVLFCASGEEHLWALSPRRTDLQPWAKKYITSSVSTSHQSLLFTEISSLCSKRSCAEKGPFMLPKEDSRKTDYLSCWNVHCKCVSSSIWKMFFFLFFRSDSVVNKPWQV